jgi:transcriptional regulator with XRE-family HTH domain
MDEAPRLIEAIERYMAQHNMNRARFALFIGVAPSTIDKLLSDNHSFSQKMLTKIEAKTGLISSSKMATFDFEVGRPARPLITHLEGDYQAIRPSFREEGMLHTYVISISWDDRLGGLVFDEKHNDLAPKNKGCVSVPVYNRMMYLLSCDKGNFRLAILSDGYQPGIFYGVMTTVSSHKMIDKIPTSTLFAIKKLGESEEPCNGIIRPDNSKFEELNALLQFARKEGFLRVLA